VDKSIQIGLVINLPENIDSVRLSVTAEGKALFDTLFRSFGNSNGDTIWKVISFADTGYKLVTVVPYSQVVNLLPVSAGITIVKKASTTQPDNHPPKWSDTTLSVALNDTARYELNLSPLCSDPDKDLLRYAISGKTLPGDTIIDSLYVFQASVATIGKNSVELIASDPSGLTDTMELVLTVTVSGKDTNPPEVTVIAPDKDSSVTNSETYSIDLLCSDVSGIDSVYAMFNGTTTSAVLANEHYKINITGLVAGVYNVIQLTVIDKSINVLTTTKTVKIKYVPSYAITYNGNGNSSGTIPIDTGKYATGVTVAVKGNTGNLVKTGFTFAGWNTAADGSGTAYADGSTLNMGTSNVTLFARWTQNPTFTVTYDGNTNTTGAVPSDAGKYEAGTSVTVKENTGALVKTGFTFAGWNTAADGSGTAYAMGSTFNMGTGNVTLFARWTQNPTFTVTYDGNTNTAGTVPSDAGKYEAGTLVTVKENTGALVKTGFTFAGWNTAADGSGTAYAMGSTFNMGTGNVTLFARWTQNPTFTVTYDGNTNTTGAVPSDAGKYEAGTLVTVKENTGALVKTGFTFAGWNTAADGSGTAYAMGSTFNMGTGNVTLFARWTQNPTFTVTYDGNTTTTGTVPSDAGKYETGASVTVKGNTGNLVKTGFTFAGWNTAADGSGTAYTEGSTFKMGSENVTLFARWTLNATYSVTYDGNTNTAGTVPSDAGKYEAESSVTVKLNTGSLVKTGFTFAGWNTAADGSGTAYAEGSIFKMGTGNVTLFAHWTLNPTFTVTYDANTGTGTAPADVNKYETGAVITVLGSGTLVKKGYTFTGWNTLADGSGTARASATTFNMTAINVTLYAQWKLKQYTVTYIGNGNVGGSVPVDANQYDTGASVTVLGNTGALTKTGYTFDGWNTAENGSGTSFVAGTGTFVISSNTTLFAKWKIKTYTLSYAGNGSTGGTVPADVTLDSNALATVTANTGSLSKTGFDFNGWNTMANGSGTALASGATFRIKSDTTLYAQWTVKKYTLTISAPVNGTVNLSGNVSVDSNATTTITATASSGFRFKCWRVTSGSAIITDTTAASTSVKLTQGNATIKAVFGCFTFEILVDDNITPNAITQGNDGNYYFVSSAGKSPVVKKLDPQGNVVATKTYGYGVEDYLLNSIKATSDGNLIMGGTSDGKLDITKISQNLNMLTSGSYDIEEKYETLWGSFAFETKSGSYILGGGRPSSIIKMQSIGGASQTYYGVSSICDLFTDGQEVNDGGLIFTGDDRYDFDIIKTDANGKLLWENTYPDLYRGNSIRQTSDGGFIAGGSGMSSGFYCDGLVKISSTGTALWQKINPLGTGIKTVRQTADGGFVYVSNTQTLGNGENDIYLVKTDSKGEIIWNKTFGTSSNEYVRGMELTKDGGFIILGGSDNKCYVIKTDENGNVDK
jgi:uncharacterized repeat protein (TIGR02543 family)